MDLNLAGKTVIVTGGGSNIGRAIALAFARERAHVVIADIDEGQGRKVATEAETLGAKALAARTDVTRLPDVQALVRTTEDRFGRVDVLVNNVVHSHPFIMSMVDSFTTLHFDCLNLSSQVLSF